VCRGKRSKRRFREGGIWKDDVLRADAVPWSSRGGCVLAVADIVCAALGPFTVFILFF